MRSVFGLVKFGVRIRSGNAVKLCDSSIFYCFWLWQFQFFSHHNKIVKMDAKMNAKVMNSRRNMQKLINRCLKLRSIEIGVSSLDNFVSNLLFWLFFHLQDDMLFVDILKTLQFLDKTLKTNFHEVIEYALDFSSGINVSFFYYLILQLNKIVPSSLLLKDPVTN